MSDSDDSLGVSMPDVLLVDENPSASVLTRALRPLPVAVAHSVDDARHLLSKNDFRVVLLGYSRAHLPVERKVRLLPPSAFQTEERRGTLRKPFGQLALQQAISDAAGELVSLNPIWTAEDVHLGGETIPAGPRALAIAQVQRFWRWTADETQAFRHFLSHTRTEDIASLLGVPKKLIDSRLTRATAKARSALGLSALRKTELRFWILNRVMPPG